MLYDCVIDVSNTDAIAAYDALSDARNDGRNGERDDGRDDGPDDDGDGASCPMFPGRRGPTCRVRVPVRRSVHSWSSVRRCRSCPDRRR